MVENKLLLPWTDGEPIICHVVDSYVAAEISPIAVVTGRDAEAVTARLAAYPLTFVHNPKLRGRRDPVLGEGRIAGVAD